MTAFTVGMISAVLWAGVVVALWLLHRSSPGHPFRSIRGFRRARRTLHPVAAGPYFADAPAPPDPEPAPAAESPALDATREIEELTRVLDSITAEVPERPVVLPPPARRPRPPRRGPRKIGRFTYVLVDDQGRPSLD